MGRRRRFHGYAGHWGENTPDWKTYVSLAKDPPARFLTSLCEVPSIELLARRATIF